MATVPKLPANGNRRSADPPAIAASALLSSEFSAHRRRRSGGRRKTDRGGYVDVYDSRTWGIAISVMVLSCLDAVLTGVQIADGKSSEANPIMNLALYHGGFYTFFSLKAAMTAFPLAILVLHKEWALARYAARLCLWSYICVALYHLYLFLA